MGEVVDLGAGAFFKKRQLAHEVRERCVQGCLRVRVRACLDLDHKAMLEGVRHLVACKQHIRVAVQLPAGEVSSNLYVQS